MRKWKYIARIESSEDVEVAQIVSIPYWKKQKERMIQCLAAKDVSVSPIKEPLCKCREERFASSVQGLGLSILGEGPVQTQPLQAAIIQSQEFYTSYLQPITNQLPTRDTLMRGRIEVRQMMCRLCKSERETNLHWLTTYTKMSGAIIKQHDELSN